MHLDNYLNFFYSLNLSTVWIPKQHQTWEGLHTSATFRADKFINACYITYINSFIFTHNIHLPSFQLSVLLHGVMVMEAHETKANITRLTLCSDIVILCSRHLVFVHMWLAAHHSAYQWALLMLTYSRNKPSLNTVKLWCEKLTYQTDYIISCKKKNGSS